MKAGDFLLGSDWYTDSYSFYQVVKATAKTVSIRRVGNNNGTPVFNRFIDDEVITKRVSGDRVRLGSWSSAELWNGVPFHSEHPLFGVNYNLY